METVGSVVVRSRCRSSNGDGGGERGRESRSTWAVLNALVLICPKGEVAPFQLPSGVVPPSPGWGKVKT